MKQNFPRYVVLAESCRAISNFNSHHFQPNLTTQFYKKLFFVWIFFPKEDFFPQKSGCVTHNPTWTPTTMLSFRKSHCVNSKKTSRQIEGRTDLEPSSHGHRTKRTKRSVRSLFWHFLPKIYTNWSFKRKLIHNTLEYSWFSTIKQKSQKFNEMILRERQKASLHPFWAI